MKVVSRNVAFALYEKAETLSQQPHESWRCIYLKLSDKKDQYSSELRTIFIVKPITDMLESMDGYIFLCEDGDIFILFSGKLKPVVEKLSSHFGDLDPNQLRGQSQDSMFAMFDLGKQWTGFYDLCEAKYLQEIIAQEEKRFTFTYTPPEVKASLYLSRK